MRDYKITHPVITSLSDVTVWREAASSHGYRRDLYLSGKLEIQTSHL